jgi:hypothetical protein
MRVSFLKDRLVSVERLSNNTTIEIFHTENIAMSIAYTFFLRALAEVIEQNLVLQFTGMDLYQYSGFYALLDKKVIGIITYHIIIEKKTMIIKLSSIEKKYRNQGIYSILYKWLEKTSIERKNSYIISWTHKKNSVGLISAEKTGRILQYIIMGKRII